MKYRVLLGLLIVVSVCVSACDILPKPDEPEETQIAQDAPTVLPTSKSNTQGEPTATPQSNAQGAPTATSKPPEDLRADAGDYGELKSYRLYATRTDQESGEMTELTTACVLDPFALHTIATQGDRENIEMIGIENSVWMRFPGQGWYKTEFTPEEMADMEKALQEDPELGDLPDIPPWPQEALFLPGQISLPLVEGSLTRAGTETINGVSCAKYAVSSNYSYEIDMPTLGQIDTTIQATGTIWVADQGGLPPIVMQADVYETEIVTTPAGETTSSAHIEHQVTEINEPIAIEPPEGAVEMGSGILPDVDDPSLPTGDPDDTAPTAALDDLDSYRLEWLVTIKQEEDKAQSTYLFEWIREPSTYRLVTDMMGISVEYLWSGDKAWIKPAGSSDWTEISSDEAPDPFDALGGVNDWDEDMIPDGEETVNGIHCKCYIAEATTPYGTSSHRICVADQAGIPSLVIRGLLQMEQQGSTTIMESNLYDINQPIVIETPE